MTTRVKLSYLNLRLIHKHRLCTAKYLRSAHVAAMNSKIQISATKLTKIFSGTAKNREAITAYKDLSFHVNRGEFLCILGPSGCGKTTLLRTIASLEKASSGELRLAPSSHGIEANIGMVFQERSIFPWMTVAQNIRFLLENNPRINPNKVSAIVEDYLSKVGLEKFANYFPYQISGGMKQRVSIARSFANDPDMLLMDEPFVFLDYQTRMRLQELLLTIWQGSKKTVVFVTHDIEEAVLLADRILVMTAHPGHIKDIVDVDLPRPRHINDIRKSPQFHTLVDTISKMIRNEMSDLLPAIPTSLSS